VAAGLPVPAVSGADAVSHHAQRYARMRHDAATSHLSRALPNPIKTALAPDIIEGMPHLAKAPRARRPRFRRASEPPAFRLTDDDITMVRLLARYRFLRSTHIAALVGRSLDRTNDRLSGLFHHGYVDRPRAQLDYYPTTGSGPMI